MSETSCLSSPQAAVGRADLLRMRALFGGEAASYLAEMLDFELRPEVKAPVELTFPKPEGFKPTMTAPVEPKQPDPEAELPNFFEPWYLKSFEPIPQVTRGEPQAYADLKPLDRSEMAANYAAVIPRQIPILAWSQLWPYFRGSLGQWRETGGVRVGKVIESMVSGRWPRAIPRETRLTWADSCQVILDFSPRLRPFRKDFEGVLGPLKALRGASGLDIWVADQGCRTRLRKYKERESQAYQAPLAGTPVLVLSDLGMYLAEPEERQRWLVLGQTLRHHQCIPLALVPCPRDQWDPDLANAWHLAAWDDADRLPPVVRRQYPHQSPLPENRENQQRKQDNLAAFLAPAASVQPEVLRAARKSLSPQQADVGSEYALWNNPQARRSTEEMVLDPEAKTHYLAKFANFGREKGLALLALLEKHHAWMGDAVLHEARLTVFRELGLPHEAQETYFQRMSKQVEAGNNCLGNYVDDLSRRQPAVAWQHQPGLVVLWLKRNKDGVLAGKVAIPAGMDIEPFRWVLDLEGEVTEWLLRWEGQSLVFQKNQAALQPDAWQQGSPLGRLAMQAGFLTHGPKPKGVMRSLALAHHPILALPQKQAWTLRGQDGIYHLQRLTHPERPFWAKALGCDARGLFGVAEDKEGRRRIYWLPPGSIQVHDRVGQDQGTWHLKQGTWMAEDQVVLFATGIFVQPDWCDGIGVDDWGIYADLAIANSIQRFRWIWPGTFLMGSQENEQGRTEIETQHKVTLSRGYWLADTACPQNIWSWTIGESLMWVKGKEKPAVDLSWENCDKMLKELNLKWPNLELKLPSEAQWEYACRAGTQTVFHFGDSITTDQVNYRGTDPLEGSPEGEYRQKTVPVKALPANAWGLYQMHGNVWEWCQDWLADYTAEPQRDPVGPDSGQYRVLRGGSWFFGAKYCRSAARFGIHPGYRSGDFGFRLARGQKEPEVRKQQAPGPTARGDRVLSDQEGERQL